MGGAGGVVRDQAKRFCVCRPPSRPRATLSPSQGPAQGTAQCEYQGTVIEGAKAGVCCALCIADSEEKDLETLQRRLRTLRVPILSLGVQEF